MMKEVFASAYITGALWLLGWEFAAFGVNTQYTISELWWHLEGPGFTFARYMTLVALAFLLLHLTFGFLRLQRKQE